MWSPADVFTHGVDVFLAPPRKALTYLYEHPLALGAMFVSIALLIFVSETVSSRIARRRRP